MGATARKPITDRRPPRHRKFRPPKLALVPFEAGGSFLKQGISGKQPVLYVFLPSPSRKLSLKINKVIPLWC